MRLLPPATVPGRVLAISVDLPRHLFQACPASPQPSECFPARLARVFESYNVAVTWGFDDPSSAAAIPRLAARSSRDEIALSRCAAAAGAHKSADLWKLAVRAEGAVRTDRKVSTVLVNGEISADDQAVLVRHGVNLVALGQPGAEGPTGLRTLRFGLWQMAATWRLPGPRGWLRSRLAAASGRRRIDRAIARQELLHLSVDGAALAGDRGGMRTLERILRHVVQRRHQGLLTVLTLCEVARQLSPSRIQPPAHSILKAQAA